jgi:hypothetical protein
MAFLRAIRWIFLIALIAIGGAWLYAATRPLAADFDPGAPIGRTTGSRIAALAGEKTACARLLTRAGIAYRALPARAQGADCGFSDGVAWEKDGAREVLYAPSAPPLACPLATALAVWEWNVVQPAAVRAFGTTVARIDHFGSYACRRIYGRKAGNWSEHARAAAIDIAGVRLTDGRRITVAADWKGGGSEARFLHEIRNGACGLFGTTLSPDYNAAHRDHLHLDEARRGGFRVCR